jgi:hypothetical protein
MWSYDVLMTEVHNNRPGSILYTAPTTPYGAHYVTFVGYIIDEDNNKYYVIREGWSPSIPQNVYRVPMLM